MESIAFLFATMASAKKNPKDWQLHHARQLAGLQAFLDEEPKAGVFSWKHVEAMEKVLLMKSCTT